MKSVKNLVYAVLLASVLGISANAGDQGTPGFANPSPSPTPGALMASTDENPKTAALNYSDPTAGSTETSDYLFYEALAALLSVY
jgi:hypothetical protein